MNKNIVIFGSFALVVLFISGFYLLVARRANQLEQVVPQQASQQVSAPPGGITQKMIANTAKEREAVTILQRGTIVSVNADTHTLTLLTYDPTSQQPEKLLDVSTKKINGTLCWPATRQAGDTTIETKNAFFDISPTKPLSLDGETFTQTTNFSQFVNKFAFIKVDTNTPVSENLEAEQMAVLDC